MKYLLIIIYILYSAVAFPQAAVRVQSTPLFGGPHFGRVYWNMPRSSYIPRTRNTVKSSTPLRIREVSKLNLTPSKQTLEVEKMVQATLRTIKNKTFKNPKYGFTE